MTLTVYRSNRAAVLAVQLCDVLSATWPTDPFEAVPIVVGSRGMERWLRHQIATHLGVAARLDFPFPRPAFLGATRFLLSGDDARAAFWEVDGAREAGLGLSGAALTLAVIARLRSRRDEPAFQAVRGYLGDVEHATGGAVSVSSREWGFGEQVAGVLERLMHERPDDVRQWQAHPTSAGEHEWLAQLLVDVLSGAPEAPPSLHEALVALQRAPTGRPLFVFGLSTLGPSDRERIALIARHLDVHFFVLAPSSSWWQDIRTRWEGQRDRRRAKDADERATLDAELDSQNALLAANGLPSREMQAWLEDVGYEAVEPDPTALGGNPTAPSSTMSLLENLHRWLDDANPMPPRGQALFTRDRTVEFHAAHGALRQCEALRDTLLARLAADPTLEARDILVMTPDIATYAPLVASVFARRGGGAPALPTHIADLGLRATNPVAEALIHALALLDERVTATRLMDFLALDAVRERFAIEPGDLPALRDLIATSGLRWGWDAADRVANDQPGFDQNTVRFGLERLALGVLMPDPGGVSVVSPAVAGQFAPAVPVDIESRDQVERVGKLARVARQLDRLRASLGPAGTIAEWRGRLKDALDALTAMPEDRAWRRAEVDGQLDELLPDGGEPGLLIDRAAVARMLEGAFDEARRGDRPITGAVTVCALEPMRSVPFRVIALVGMDDGVFPRTSRLRSWDPFSTPKKGEHDRRVVDRHLLLEAVLSAQSALIVSWTGFDSKLGRAEPASVAIEELVETVAALTGVRREALVTVHPLQPWSPSLFSPAAAFLPAAVFSPVAASSPQTAGAEFVPRSFDAGMAAAARSLDAIASGRSAPTPAGLEASTQDDLGPELMPPTEVRLDELARDLLAPLRTLLRSRLGLRLGDEDTSLADREPIELNHLDGWQIRERVGRVLDAEPDAPLDRVAAEMVQRLGGEGSLPIEAGGRRVVDGALEEAKAARDVAKDIVGEVQEGRSVRVLLDDGTWAIGAVPTVRQAGEVRLAEWLTNSATARARDLLTAWVTLLAANVDDPSVQVARIIGHGDEGNSKRAGGTFLTAPVDAKAALTELVSIWRQARRRPLPLFKSSSPALAAVVHGLELPLDSEGRRAAVGALRKAWPDDVDSPEVAAFFGSAEPESLTADDGPGSTIDLALRVWGPVLEAQAGGKVSATEWVNP